MSAPDRDRSVLAGRRPVAELLRAGRSAERILLARGLKPAPVLAEIRRRAESAAIPLRTVPRGELDRIAGDANHQGVVAVTGRYRYTPLDDLLAVPRARLLFLDGVTDPHNLGSLLRSAEGAGFGGVVLPARRSVGVTDVVRRVSAGAGERVPVARVTNLARALQEAAGAGLWIVGLDADADDDIWSTDLLEPPIGLVLGSEGGGLSPVVGGGCDGFVRIPSGGKLGSLNVAVAGAVAMFEVARRLHGESDTL